MPVLAGVKVTCAGDEYVLGTASNHANKPKVVKMSMDAFKNILFVKDAKCLSEHGLNSTNTNLGEPFTKSTATAKFADIVQFCTSADEDEEYCVVLFPVSFLFG